MNEEQAQAQRTSANTRTSAIIINVIVQYATGGTRITNTADDRPQRRTRTISTRVVSTACKGTGHTCCKCE